MQNENEFTPKLVTTDWNDEWIELQDTRKAADSAEYWDERSKTFHKKPGSSPYIDTFLEYANLDPSDSVLDMGCGNGALSIPLALAGHNVIAADFSRGMLDSLRSDAQKHGDLPIDIKQFSWEDDWRKFGVDKHCVDVAIASRSIATHDLKDSLLKLSTAAKKRCCITLSVGTSPRVDATILSELGIQPRLGRDFVYAFMILQQIGFLPEIRYIPSVRRDSYSSSEDAFASLEKMVVDAGRNILASEELTAALERLKDWIEINLIPNPEVGMIGPDGAPQKEYILKTPRKITWAFISWDVSHMSSVK